MFIRCLIGGLLLLGIVSACGVGALSAEPSKVLLTKLPWAYAGAMENTPIVFQGRPLLVLNYRDDTKSGQDGYKESMYLYLRDLTTGQEVSRLAEGHSFANALVDGSRLVVFATEGTDRDWFQSIYRFTSEDLQTWRRELAIEKEAGERLFNCSVCRDEQGYVMAYESNQPVQFCFKFARSKDLGTWEKIPGLVFTGEKNEYSACPALRYCAPYYYVLYLHAATAEHPGWITYLARSKDLVTWNLSPLNPILEASAGEGVNNSDVDLFEWQGHTYLFYATGDQATWGAVRTAMYPGSMRQFFESCFPDDVESLSVSTQR